MVIQGLGMGMVGSTYGQWVTKYQTINLSHCDLSRRKINDSQNSLGYKLFLQSFGMCLGSLSRFSMTSSQVMARIKGSTGQ